MLHLVLQLVATPDPYATGVGVTDFFTELVAERQTLMTPAGVGVTDFFSELAVERTGT
jgi:hypothetical protein